MIVVFLFWQRVQAAVPIHKLEGGSNKITTAESALLGERSEPHTGVFNRDFA